MAKAKEKLVIVQFHAPLKPQGQRDTKERTRFKVVEIEIQREREREPNEKIENFYV